MNQSFLERYNKETTWQSKAIVMEIYHLSQCELNTQWTIYNTAHYFKVSVGLVSENLKLARIMNDTNEEFKDCSRKQALKRIRK